MTDWLFFLIILAMPWKPEYYADILEVPIVWSNSRCICAACYYDDTLYLASEWRDSALDPQLGHVLIHELNHHFQGEEQIWRNEGGWVGFRDLVAEYVTEPDGLTHRQRAHIRFLWSKPSELHAELPYILTGNIPPELASWYPWFDVEEK